MNTRALIWIGMTIGSTLGGFIPNLWGTSFFSLAGLVWSGIGGLFGIWIARRAANSF
jgi:predicted MFS family arabinose efflux permease